MIGILGGTFNPVHYGHLLICEAIREEFSLEKVLLVPAQIPPHKSISDILEADIRLEMVQLAIKSNPFFEASDIEMRRKGPSYTVDTIAELKEHYGPGVTLNLILGADSMIQIPTWRRFEDILKNCEIIVAKRPDTREDLLQAAIEKLQTENGAVIKQSKAVAMDFSSTEIRERAKMGLSIKYRVPEAVEAYILSKGLYR